jgi:hypothetical protein
MFNRIVSLFLVINLVFVVPEAFAGKGGGGRSSGAGRSYSSGGASKSAGRSYSSGGGSKPASSSSASKASSSGKTYSSSPVVKSGSNKSYSTGSSNSQPAVKSGSGKSYSTGSSLNTQSSPSSSENSGKKYSSSSPSSPSNPSSALPGKNLAGSPPPSTGPPNKSVDGNSRKPNSTGFNNSLSNDAKRVESQKKYAAATAPKSTYTSKGSDGVTRQSTIKPNSPQVQTVRRYVTHERYVTYDNRANTFYGGFYGSPMYYHDPFSPFLMGWIMSDALNSHDRAMWMYHHQSDMDSSRYEEMLRKDAKLQAEIDQLKAQNVARDPSYVPPQMAENPDLMFNKDFVDASYNPVEVESSSGSTFFWLFVIFMVVFVGGIAIYFFFFKEY